MNEQQALSRLQTLCSRQEKCTADVMQKLNDWEVAPEKAAQIIKKLIGDKFIDDQRYAKAFVRDRFKFNQWGKIKIALHLRKKNIGEDLITCALEGIGRDEYKHFVKTLMMKKRKSMDEKNIYRLKSKLIRYLQSKGIEFDEIMEAMESIQHS